MYTIRAQSMTNDKLFQTFETDDFKTYMETIVGVAQSRKRGKKMRLASVTETSAEFVVQLTGATD